MLIDSHIHVGQFRDLYSSPSSVYQFLQDNGVDTIAVSSSSTCSGDWELVLDEIKEISSLGGSNVVPVLWICPNWLDDGTINKMLDSGIKWKCLKIHGYFHKWEECPETMEKVIELAKGLNVPLLFHTGGRPASDAISYKKIILDHPNVNFILAHSRPVDQAIEVLDSCKNAWADTAFTPLEDIRKMVEHGFSKKILWGTDYPLHNVFYEGQDRVRLINEKLSGVKSFTTPEQFDDITYNNAMNLFKLNIYKHKPWEY